MGILTIVKELLFPKSCFGCSRLGAYICFDCAARLRPLTKDTCPYCSKASFMGFTHPMCKRKNGVDGIKSIFLYDPLSKKVISQIKYTLVKEAVAEFILSIPPQKREEIKDFLRIVKDAIVVPVPLHSSRFKKRGFNQSEKLAVELSKYYPLEIKTTLVKRVRKTQSQAKIASFKKRLENVRGAFAISDKINANQNIIIFDDVWTTGSTIKELTRVFKKNGARSVFALTTARAY